MTGRFCEETGLEVMFHRHLDARGAEVRRLAMRMLGCWCRLGELEVEGRLRCKGHREMEMARHPICKEVDCLFAQEEAREALEGGSDLHVPMCRLVMTSIDEQEANGHVALVVGCQVKWLFDEAAPVEDDR